MMVPQVREEIQAKRPESVVLFGIETHVCVQQTALDLLEDGISVHIVADGVSSRSPTDRSIALDRLRQSGAFVTTHEAVLFELAGDATHPEFKEVSALVRAQTPDSKLLAPFTPH